jgi:hypothetical protein
MAPHVYASLRHALEQDGWLASQSLLVWGTDDTGARRDLIIDGEHRWTVARELGFTHGPVVFLDGITEARAKALTIAMNNRRGEFDDALLAELVQSIQAEIDAANLALDLALADDDLMKMLAVEPVEVSLDIDAAPAAQPAQPLGVGAPASSVRMVQLFFDSTTIEPFNAACAKLSRVFGTKTVTDTVAVAVQRMAAGGCE